jgi:CRISPR/Cas system CSM-associated protein Csm3 (group 7 of RAMP superfamily)
MSYPIRYIARFLIEAATPLAVGSGDSDLLTDFPVSLDCNGLPMIPGTSLCGVLRHSLLRECPDYAGKIKDIFGYQNGDDGEGSRLVVSSALLAGSEGRVIEEPVEINQEAYFDDFYRHFLNLPMRQHCKINERGVADAKAHGKFDNRVVYKGSRFVFEIELAGKDADKQIWDEVIATVKSPLFRIGGGVRKGYGALKVLDVTAELLDLSEPGQLQTYLDRSSSLVGGKLSDAQAANDEVPTPKGFTTYKLTLKPDDFFLFGAGYGDQKVDMKPVFEKKITWADNKPEFSKELELALIPASSIKGAISHRTAYHYNRLEENFADFDSVDIAACTGENNEAVQVLFGSARGERDDTGERGHVIVSDIFLSGQDEKILNHVAIDRFTQGAIDGALFSERVLAGGEFTLELLVENSILCGNVQKAFENALTDITTGMLPLGGGVMRGHGVFDGSWEKEGNNG